MKNITVSLDDELYRRSRIAAAESDTSVTALVREFLAGFTEGETSDKSAEVSKSVMKVIRKMRRRHPGFNPENLLSREEAHMR